MKGKYEFLKSIQFQIYELMVEVESTDIDKTDIILIRLRQVIEKIVKKLIEINNINNRRELYKNIELLKENNIIPKKIQEYFYDIRANGNKAVHEGYKDIALSKELIQKAYYILVWFSVNYGGLEIDNVELEKMNTNERVVFYEVLFLSKVDKKQNFEENSSNILNPVVFDENKFRGAKINNSPYNKDPFETVEEFVDRIEMMDRVKIGKIIDIIKIDDIDVKNRLIMFSIFEGLEIWTPKFEALYISDSYAINDEYIYANLLVKDGRVIVDINNIYLGYDGKVKVNTVILHKLFYESEHEYIERINSIGHLPVGVAYLLSEKYDMDNERLPIEMQIYKWCNKNLNESQGDIYVGRVDGKRLCSNNLYYTLVGKFKIDNSIIKITDLQIYDKLSDNKINVQLKSDIEEQIKINYELGNKYYAGEGVKVDYKKAFSYYYMSAKEGHPESQAMIGDIYFYAKGVEEDYEEAFRWYKLAAEKGDTTAQGNLAVMYCWGMGVKQDDEEGVKWGKLAAQGGDATAQANLACMYYEGKVIEKDYNEAMKWFKLSAKQENLSAKHMIGQMYYLGKGINKDYKEAFKWYISAAEQGFEASQCMVGQMYHRGEGIAMDYSEAIKWYRLAERNGYILAKERLKELGINK